MHEYRYKVPSESVFVFVSSLTTLYCLTNKGAHRWEKQIHSPSRQ